MHFESRITELDRLTDERFVTHKTMLDSQADKVALALSASDKAIGKAEKSTDNRLHLLNELRTGVATSGDFDALDRRVQDLKERLDKQEGKGLGLNAALGYLLAGVTLVVFGANYIFQG